MVRSPSILVGILLPVAAAASEATGHRDKNKIGQRRYSRDLLKGLDSRQLQGMSMAMEQAAFLAPTYPPAESPADHDDVAMSMAARPLEEAGFLVNWIQSPAKQEPTASDR